jgi:myosin heavy subunit
MAANVFGILTFITLLVSGFVAYKNKAAYENEISNTKSEKEKLAASQLRFKTAQDNLAATIATRTEVDAEVVKLTEDETAQKKVNAELKSQIETKTATAASNKEKLDEIREKTSKIGDLKELASKMRTTNAELEELSQSITANEAKLANLTAQNKQSENEAQALRTKLETMSSGKSLPTLSTRIRSIYPTWGFVTLAAGNSSGVVTNSTLDVVRDGTTVAKLLVTAVERNTSTASIIPDSLAPDTTLMVGDRVIPGQKSATPPALHKTVVHAAAQPAAN